MMGLPRLESPLAKYPRQWCTVLLYSLHDVKRTVRGASTWLPLYFPS
jgi:hypothetical protein